MAAVSSVAKLFALISAVAAIWEIWTLAATAIFIAFAVTVDVLKTKKAYTVRCEFSEGRLIVTKIKLSGKTEILESAEAKDMEEIDFSEAAPSGDNVYIGFYDDKTDDKILHINCGGKDFYILSDIYMYSLIIEAKEKRRNDLS